MRLSKLQVQYLRFIFIYLFYLDHFWGYFVVEESELPIKSIELQLVRVETVGSAEGFAKEGRIVNHYGSRTYIQTLKFKTSKLGMVT